MSGVLGWLQWVMGLAVGDTLLETLGRVILLMAVVMVEALIIVRDTSQLLPTSYSNMCSFLYSSCTYFSV